MLKLILNLFGVFLVCAFSCSRGIDENCIKTESFESSTPYLDQADQARVEFLFTSNNIDFDSLQFNRIFDDSPYTNIRCYQFVNGLKIFTESLLYQFENDHAIGKPFGEIISVINIGSKSIMDQKSVVNVFLSKIEKDDPTNLNIRGCFLLEFGYYDLNAGTGNLTHDFIKAWKITIEGRSVPFGFIDDNNGTIIYYDNGSRY